MKIYNQEKTIQIQNPNLENGYLVDDKIQIGLTPAVAEVKEQGHYEVKKEYPNGGKEMQWVVDVPYVASQESEPIFEDIKVYIPFSAQELKDKKEQLFNEQNHAEIDELDQSLEYLRSTDYKTIQFAEGVLDINEFAPIKQQRETVRATVRRLQTYLADQKLLAGL